MAAFTEEQIKYLEDLIFNRLIAASRDCPLRDFEKVMRIEIKKLRNKNETDENNTTP